MAVFDEVFVFVHGGVEALRDAATAEPLQTSGGAPAATRCVRTRQGSSRRNPAPGLCGPSGKICAKS